MNPFIGNDVFHVSAPKLSQAVVGTSADQPSGGADLFSILEPELAAGAAGALPRPEHGSSDASTGTAPVAETSAIWQHLFASPPASPLQTLQQTQRQTPLDAASTLGAANAAAAGARRWHAPPGAAAAGFSVRRTGAGDTGLSHDVSQPAQHREGGQSRGIAEAIAQGPEFALVSLIAVSGAPVAVATPSVDASAAPMGAVARARQADEPTGASALPFVTGAAAGSVDVRTGALALNSGTVAGASAAPMGAAAPALQAGEPTGASAPPFVAGSAAGPVDAQAGALAPKGTVARARQAGVATEATNPPPAAVTSEVHVETPTGATVPAHGRPRTRAATASAPVRAVPAAVVGTTLPSGASPVAEWRGAADPLLRVQPQPVISALPETTGTGTRVSTRSTLAEFAPPGRTESRGRAAAAFVAATERTSPSDIWVKPANPFAQILSKSVVPVVTRSVFQGIAASAQVGRLAPTAGPSEIASPDAAKAMAPDGATAAPVQFAAPAAQEPRPADPSAPLLPEPFWPGASLTDPEGFPIRVRSAPAVPDIFAEKDGIAAPASAQAAGSGAMPANAAPLPRAAHAGAGLPPGAGANGSEALRRPAPPTPMSVTDARLAHGANGVNVRNHPAANITIPAAFAPVQPARRSPDASAVSLENPVPTTRSGQLPGENHWDSPAAAPRALGLAAANPTRYGPLKIALGRRSQRAATALNHFATLAGRTARDMAASPDATGARSPMAPLPSPRNVAPVRSPEQPATAAAEGKSDPASARTAPVVPTARAGAARPERDGPAPRMDAVAPVQSSASEPQTEPAAPESRKPVADLGQPRPATAQSSPEMPRAAGAEPAVAALRLPDEKDRAAAQLPSSGQGAADTATFAAMPPPAHAPGHVAPFALVDAATASGPGAALSRQIADGAKHLPDGPVELTLSPEELGRVRLTLATSDRGIFVTVQAERPETLDLIRRSIDHLARDFRDLGYANTTFAFGDRPQGGQAHTQPQAPTPPQPPEPVQPAQTPRHAEPAPEPAAPDVAAGLDLRL